MIEQPKEVLECAERLLQQLEQPLAPVSVPTDGTALAYRWESRPRRGVLQAYPIPLRLDDLQGIVR